MLGIDVTDDEAASRAWGAPVDALPDESAAWFSAEEAGVWALRQAMVRGAEVSDDGESASVGDSGADAEVAILAQLRASFEASTDDDSPVEGLQMLTRQLARASSASAPCAANIDALRRALRAARRIEFALEADDEARLRAHFENGAALLAALGIRESGRDHGDGEAEAEAALAGVNAGMALQRLVARMPAVERFVHAVSELEAREELMASEADGLRDALLFDPQWPIDAVHARLRLPGPPGATAPWRAFARLRVSTSEEGADSAFEAWDEWFYELPAGQRERWFVRALGWLHDVGELALADRLAFEIGGDVPVPRFALMHLSQSARARRAPDAFDRILETAGRPNERDRGEWLEAQAALGRAEALLEHGDARGALRELRRATGADADAMQAWLREIVGPLDRAEELWQRLAEEAPGPRSLAGLGRVCARRGDPERAAELLERAFQAGHDRWADTGILVDAYLECGRIAEAERWLETAEARGVGGETRRTRFVESALSEAQRVAARGNPGEADALLEASARFTDDGGRVAVARWSSRVSAEGAQGAAEWVIRWPREDAALLSFALIGGASVDDPVRAAAARVVGERMVEHWSSDLFGYALLASSSLHSGAPDAAAMAAEAGIGRIRGDLAAEAPLAAWPAEPGVNREHAVSLYATLSQARSVEGDVDGAVHAVARGLAHLGSVPALIRRAGTLLASDDVRDVERWERTMRSVLSASEMARLVERLRDARAGSVTGAALQVREVPKRPSSLRGDALRAWVERVAEDVAGVRETTEERVTEPDGRMPGTLAHAVPKVTVREVDAGSWQLRHFSKASDGFES